MFSVGGTALGGLFNPYLILLWSDSLRLCTNLKIYYAFPRRINGLTSCALVLAQVSHHLHTNFSDHISFISLQISISMASNSSPFTTLPHRLNRLSSRSFDRP